MQNLLSPLRCRFPCLLAKLDFHNVSFFLQNVQNANIRKCHMQVNMNKGRGRRVTINRAFNEAVTAATKPRQMVSNNHQDSVNQLKMSIISMSMRY